MSMVKNVSFFSYSPERLVFSLKHCSTAYPGQFNRTQHMQEISNFWTKSWVNPFGKIKYDHPQPKLSSFFIFFLFLLVKKINKIDAKDPIWLYNCSFLVFFASLSYRQRSFPMLFLTKQPSQKILQYLIWNMMSFWKNPIWPPPTWNSWQLLFSVFLAF